MTTNGHGIPASNSSHNVVLNNDSHKEFDPLTKRPEPVEASKIGTQTPDSMNSLELSASQKNFERLRENDESYSQASHPIVQPQAQTPHMQMPMVNKIFRSISRRYCNEAKFNNYTGKKAKSRSDFSKCSRTIHDEA